MGTFRNFTARIGQPGVPGTPAASAAVFGGEVGAALETAGEVGLKESRRLQEFHEQRDIIKQYRDSALAREQINASMDEAKQSGEPISEKFGAVVDEVLGELGAERETSRGRSLAEQHRITIRADVMQDARTYDAALAGEEAKETVIAIINANGARLQKNPAMLPQIIEEQNQLINDLKLPDKTLEKTLRRNLHAAAARNAAHGWITIDPTSAKQLIEDGEFDKWIDDVTRVQLIGKAETRIRLLEREERVKRAEFEQQKLLTNNQVMNEAIRSALGKDDDRLTIDKVIALSEQTHSDGDPILTPGQVLVLANLVEKMAKGTPVTTSPAVATAVIPALDTMTPEAVTARFMEGDMSVPDYERWYNTTVEGPSALKSVRANALRAVPAFFDVPAAFVQMIPAFSRLHLELDALSREREQEFRAAEKNPIDYYRDGEFEKDAKSLGVEFKLLSAGAQVSQALVDPKIDDIMGNSKFIGGNPLNKENWILVTEEEKLKAIKEGRYTPITPEQIEEVQRILKSSGTKIPGIIPIADIELGRSKRRPGASPIADIGIEG